MIGMRFEGGEALAARLAALPDRLSLAIRKKALLKAAVPIQVAAERAAPRGRTRRRGPSGNRAHLKDNIGISYITKTGRDPHVDIAVKIGPTREVFHGFFVERGTARNGAQPFLGPAFRASLSQVIYIERVELWKAIEAALPTAFPAPSGFGGGLL